MQKKLFMFCFAGLKNCFQQNRTAGDSFAKSDEFN